MSYIVCTFGGELCFLAGEAAIVGVTGLFHLAIL